jgi:hypothetical protein
VRRSITGTLRCFSGLARTAARGTYTCMNAAEGGHLEVLQWARANSCPCDEVTCSGAAEGGHLEVLQWARANGCPWDEHTCGNAAYGWSQETFSSAAEYYGYLEVLQWARANGCPGFPRVATEDGRTSNSSIRTHGVGRQHIFGRLLVLSVGLGIFLFKLLVVFRVV